MAPELRHWSETTAAGYREAMRRAPPEKLREYVIGYAGYFDDTGIFRQLTVPSAGVVMILSFGAPLRILPRLERLDEEEHDSFIAGLDDSPGIIEATGLSYGIQVDLTPIGARLLTGIPMHLFANRVLDVEEVFGDESAFLIERLQQLPGWASRFEVLDLFIEHRVARGEAPAGVLWAYRALSRTAGGASISGLAGQLGQSQKHLIDQFREYVGLPPKTMARILRFDRAMQMMRGTDTPDYARIAAECGYYDQAHFNREFREFTGMTPSKFVAQRGQGSDFPIERL